MSELRRLLQSKSPGKQTEVHRTFQKQIFHRQFKKKQKKLIQMQHTEYQVVISRKDELNKRYERKKQEYAARKNTLKYVFMAEMSAISNERDKLYSNSQGVVTVKELLQKQYSEYQVVFSRRDKLDKWYERKKHEYAARKDTLKYVFMAEMSAISNGREKFKEKSQGISPDELNQAASKKRYQCTLCSYSCQYMSDFRPHIQRHTGEKPFKCPCCDFTFCGITNLNAHMRKHTGEKPYKCAECQSSFTQKSNLKRHLSTHTKQMRFKCPYCNYACLAKISIKEHICTHTGERPFKCQHCLKSFISSSKLNVHMRIHTGEKPYKCQHCEHSAATSSNLKRHMKTHCQKT